VGFSAPVRKQLHGATLVFYDLGGGNRIRGVWPNYFPDVRGALPLLLQLCVYGRVRIRMFTCGRFCIRTFACSIYGVRAVCMCVLVCRVCV
jgi:hypothetical protein